MVPAPFLELTYSVLASLTVVVLDIAIVEGARDACAIPVPQLDTRSHETFSYSCLSLRLLIPQTLSQLRYQQLEATREGL